MRKSAKSMFYNSSNFLVTTTRNKTSEISKKDDPLDTEHKLNVHKKLRRRLGHFEPLMRVQFTPCVQDGGSSRLKL